MGRGQTSGTGPSGHHVVDDGEECRLLLLLRADRLGPAEQHGGAIVHRVMESRTGEDQTVEQLTVMHASVPAARVRRAKLPTAPWR